MSEEISEQAESILSGMLDRMAIEATIELDESDENITLDIRCDDERDTNRIIGRRGQVIDAIQHLVSKMVSKDLEERPKMVIVDTDGYRSRQVERLESLANRMADKCRDSGSAVHLDPMNAYDRRLVHMVISDMDDVQTESEGEGRDRHIVILPV